MKKSHIIPFISIALLSCNKFEGNKTEFGLVGSDISLQSSAPTEALLEDRTGNHTETQVVNNAAESPISATNKKIIKTGNLSIESKDIITSKKKLDQQIKTIGGYYEQENTSTSVDFINFNLTVRIPQEKFDDFIYSIESGKDKITNKSIRAEDISLQYYDLESRLKSKRTYLDRYQKMVASAKSVKELLEIEEQIRQLQEDIERTESTLRNLKSQVGYSTLQINLFEYQANLPDGSNSFWIRIKDAFVFGWNLIETLSLALIGIWPLIILTIISIVTWKKIRRKKNTNV